MSLTTEDLTEIMATDTADDETVLLADALSELAIDAEVDSVETVPDAQERL